MKRKLKIILLTACVLLLLFFGYKKLEKTHERNSYISEISLFNEYDEEKADDYFNYHKIHPSFEIDRIITEVNEKQEKVLYYDSFFDLIKQPNRTECIKYYFQNKGVSINDVIVISNKQLLDLSYNETLASCLYLDMDSATIRKCVDYAKRNIEAKPEDIIVLNEKQLLDMKYDAVLANYLHLDMDGATIRKCVDYSKKHSEIETKDIIQIINFGLEKIEPSKQLLDLIYADFFMPTRIERYLNLYQNNNSYTPRQVVEIVNCDADQPFYTNTMPADLSKGVLVIVNKFNYLKSDYVPDNLVVVDRKYSSEGARMDKTAYDAFVEMCEAARKQQLEIKFIGDNGYRSYETQEDIYIYKQQTAGTEEADTRGARPGYSEHQTGLTVDITAYPLNGNGKYTYVWLKENCWEYGFIVRYQAGKEHLTGYIREDWHYRYVGKEVALFIKEHDITFDEYYTYFVKGY